MVCCTNSGSSIKKRQLCWVRVKIQAPIHVVMITGQPDSGQQGRGTA